MNNIEILEERINFCKNNTECREELKQCFGCTFEIEEIEAIENLIQENKKLKEYKKIAELTKISCCTAQNCEALNNAIKNGLENEKLLQENKELKERINKSIEFINDDDIFFCDGESWQNVLHIERILKGE